MATTKKLLDHNRIPNHIFEMSKQDTHTETATTGLHVAVKHSSTRAKQ
jgi:hypothetical protein